MAVLEVGGAEQPDTLAAVSDAIRAGALDALPPGYGLMTREDMATLARDMGLDLGCVEAEAECEVDVGRKIGAALVLSSRLSRIEGRPLVTLSVHDTRSGALLATGSTQAADLLALIRDLPTLGHRVASAALAKDRPDEPATTAEGQIGRGGKRPAFSGSQRVLVTFESEPAGAVVQLDGELLCAQTPCSREVAPGPHRVTMQKERHDEVSQVLELDGGSPVRLRLPARFALLTVTTSPPGLRVQLDGVRRNTPLDDHPLDPGDHELLVDEPCFAPLGERVVLEKGERRALRLDGEALIAGLDVSAATHRGDAVAANVLVDGKWLGKTPLTVKVSVCARELVVSLPGIGEKRQRLGLREGAVEAVRVTLPAPTPKRASGSARGGNKKSPAKAGGLVGSEHAMGIGFAVAGGSVAGWLGTWALSSAKATELYDSVHSAEEIAQLVREGEAASTASWVFGGAVAVGATVGLVGAIAAGEEGKRRKAARAFVVPAPTAGGAAVLVVGSF